MTVASPFVYPIFRLHPRGKERLGERYGRWDSELQRGIWMHGASMGEMQGLLPLAKLIREQPDKPPILCTALSPTGLHAAEQVADEVHLVPFDCTMWLKPVLERFTPSKYIFAETELWPVLLAMLAERRVPMHLVNARISDYTFRRYRMLGSTVRSMLRSLSTISAVDEEARVRLVDLGADPSIVQVCGNTKYDGLPKRKSADERNALRRELFPELPDSARVIVLGSVHPGEDSLWIEAALKSERDIRLVIVPRHLEKLSQFRETLKRYGMNYSLWSTRSESNESGKAVLVDASGVLRDLYAAADLAFVGGTFVDVGGHNILEAAAQGVPIAVGPFTRNIRELVAEFSAGGALAVIDETGIDELVARIDDRALFQMGEAAFARLTAHQGATQRVMERIFERQQNNAPHL